MRIKGRVKRTTLSSPGTGLALGIVGLLVVSLAISGCSSKSESQQSSQSGSTEFLQVEASATAGIKPTFTICGDPQVETVWANQTIDAGALSVTNDLDYLYLEYGTTDSWGMLKGRVHVGLIDAADYPQFGDLKPMLSEFVYRIDAPVGEVYEEYTLPIPFTDLGLPHGACGQTLYIFAWGYMAQMDEGGGIISNKVAWAGTDRNQTVSPQWMYYIEYQVQCCGGGIVGEFRTQSQGGWGTVCHGENPGCYRDEWFDTAFPDGLIIGCNDGHTMTFTSSEAVQEFVPTGGKPGALQFDYVDPTDKTEAGVLASQTLALALTLGFDAADPDFGSSADLLEDQIICDTETDFDGWSVRDLLDEANIVLGGCESPYQPGEIAEALTIVNENYVDGEVVLGFLCTP